MQLLIAAAVAANPLCDDVARLAGAQPIRCRSQG